MATKMRIFLLLMLMVVGVRAAYDVKIKIASSPVSRVRDGLVWSMVGSIKSGSGRSGGVIKLGYINIHHPMAEDIGELRKFTIKVNSNDSWLVAEWADVYHYKRKKVYRFYMRRISGTEEGYSVTPFYNPTERKLCKNVCKNGVTWNHPSCNCTVCEDRAMSFSKDAGRCGYNYLVKIKPVLCAENKVNNQLKIEYVGNTNKIQRSSVTKPNTKALIELPILSFNYAGILTSFTMELVNSTDSLEAEWADVYDYTKGAVHRFVLGKITGKEGRVTFTKPSTRVLESSPTPPVVMCHFHNTYLWRASPGKPKYDKNKVYPCTHIVFGKDWVILENDMDNRPVEIFKYLELQKHLYDLATIGRREKVLLHLLVNSFQFNLNKVVSILRLYLRYRFPGTDLRPYDGFELDIGHKKYRSIANDTAVDQLLKALRKMMDAEPTQNELSVVVGWNTKVYKIDSWSKYADYVVVKAVVDEWQDQRPDEMSTVSPSSLFKANKANFAGKSQCEIVANWLTTGLPREKIILPFTTYAWNTPYCVKGKPCVEYYKSVPHTRQFKNAVESEVYKIPFYYLSEMGHKDWMDTEPYKRMNTGPGVPFENQETVLAKMKFLKAEGLRGTKVIDIMWDTDNFQLTSIAYRELVDRGLSGNSSLESSSTVEKSGPGAGTGGLSALLVTTIICVHLYAGIEIHHVMM